MIFIMEEITTIIFMEMANNEYQFLFMPYDFSSMHSILFLEQLRCSPMYPRLMSRLTQPVLLTVLVRMSVTLFYPFHSEPEVQRLLYSLYTPRHIHTLSRYGPSFFSYNLRCISALERR